MKLKIKIIDNKVYLIRYFFFKLQIGIYDNGLISITNKQLVENINKINNKSVGIFRKLF